MIVECINNEQAKAPKVFENGYRHPEYVFNNLTVGASYFVYGIGVFRDDLRYLVETNFRRQARWFSPYLFEVRDDRVPPHWVFRYEVIEGAEPLERVGCRAMAGYPELVHNFAHSDGLMELYPEDQAIFEREVERRADLGY